MMPLDLFITQTALKTKQRLGKLITKDWAGQNKRGTTRIYGHIAYCMGRATTKIRSTTYNLRCMQGSKIRETLPSNKG